MINSCLTHLEEITFWSMLLDLIALPSSPPPLFIMYGCTKTHLKAVHSEGEGKLGVVTHEWFFCFYKFHRPSYLYLSVR